MKRFSSLMLGALLFWQCAGLQGPKEPVKKPAVDQSSDCRKQQQVSDRVRSNPDIYWGEAFAPIVDGDIGKAKENAKNSAIADLSRNISIVIRSDLVITVIGKEGGDLSGYEEIMKHTIETLTRNVLEELSESEPFIDCPGRGNLAYYVWVAKEKYQERVKNDLEAKKSIVMSQANDGLKAWNSGDYVKAVRNMGEARARMMDFFRGLPLMASFALTGDTLELSRHLQDRMDDFFQNLNLEVLNEGFVYDAGGRLNRQPIIYAYYVDREGRKNPVPALPLRVTFEEGTGRVGEMLTTKAPRGVVEMSITGINPSAPTATIIVEVDDSGMDGISMTYRPVTRIKIMKKAVVAIAVQIDSLESGELRKHLSDQLTSDLLKLGADVVHIVSSPDTPILKAAERRNADFLLSFQLTSNTPVTVPPYNNLYEVIMSGTGELKSVSTGSIRINERLSVVKGYGSTPGNARGDAYSKILAQVPGIVKKISTELQ